MLHTAISYSQHIHNVSLYRKMQSRFGRLSMQFVFLLMSALAVSLFASPTFAGGHHHKSLEKMVDRLDLNKQQQELFEDYVDAMHSNAKNNRKEMRKQYKEDRQKIREFWMQESISLEDISAFYADMTKQKTAAMEARQQSMYSGETGEALVAFHASLDENQRKKFAKHVSRFTEGMRKKGHDDDDDHH